MKVSTRAATFILVISAVLLCKSEAASPIVVSAKCDTRGMIPQGSPFWGHLGFLLQQLADNTPYIPSLSFRTRVGGSDNPAYGEASCKASSPPAQCQACLLRLSSDIWRICNSALGARVEYPNCWIHYEDHYFRSTSV